MIVEDAEAAEQLMGKYRMVTLDGKLYEKSSAITGGYVKKSIFGFGQNDDKELENAKQMALELLNQETVPVLEMSKKCTKCAYYSYCNI